MATTFFSSDQHFSHARISEFSGRPFSNVPQMNAFLVNAWNSRVTDADTVFVLGDVCMGKLDESLALIGLLAGTKILVPGNHDRCWSGHTAKHRPEQAVARYLDAGFAEVVQSDADTVPGLSWPGGEPHAIMSHFPYVGDSGDLDRHVDHRPHDDGETWLLHGHVHEKWRQRGRMINVGVDAWAGKPVSMDAVADLIASGPRDLAPKAWHTPPV